MSPQTQQRQGGGEGREEAGGVQQEHLRGQAGGWWRWLVVVVTSEAAGRARQLQCGGEASLHPPVSPTPRTGHHPVISTLFSHFLFFDKLIHISYLL